jgi:hypothetical protein
MKLSRATAIAAFLATAQAFTISNGPRYVEIGMTPITSSFFTVDNARKARDICLSVAIKIIKLLSRYQHVDHRKKIVITRTTTSNMMC